MKYRLRPSLLALLALLCAGALHAQPTLQTVRGRVVDANTGEPVPTASIRVVEDQGNAAVSGQTDVVGRFSIRVPIAGTYHVTAERIGFRVSTSDPVVVAAGATVDVEVRMAPSAVALDSVGVRVRQTPNFRDPRAARFYERMDRMRGTYLTPEQIAAKPGMRAADLLRDMRTVHVESDYIRGTVLQVGVSSLRRCTPTLYIDGRRRRLEEGERLDDIVDRQRLWAIEVYAEPEDAPSELPPDDNFRCGVVVIWTRSA
jgi:hypothetical protein